MVQIIATHQPKGSSFLRLPGICPWLWCWSPEEPWTSPASKTCLKWQESCGWVPCIWSKICGGRWGTRNNIHYGILCHEVHFCRDCDHGLAWYSYVYKYHIHVALLKPHHMYTWLIHWISQGACTVRLDVHGIIQRLHSQKLLQNQLEQNVYPLTLRATSPHQQHEGFQRSKNQSETKKLVAKGKGSDGW